MTKPRRHGCFTTLALHIFWNAMPTWPSLPSVLAPIILALCLTSFLEDVCIAGGPVHGAKSAGMGNAFTATADDPSAIMHNPAGLTNLSGTNIYAGATAVIPSTKYTSPGGGSEETQFQVFVPPHIYASSDFGMDNLAFGLGIYSPFGIGGRIWDETGLTRYRSVESMIATFSVNPCVAWRVTPSLSVGFGADYMWSFNKAKNMLDQSFVGAPDAKLKLEADGGGWGYNAGILLFPGRKFSLGAAYRTGIEVDQTGTLSIVDIASPLQPLFGGPHFKTDVETTIDFPEIVNFGIAYRPTQQWTVGLGAEWVGWSSFDKQVLDLKTEAPEVGLSDVTTVFDWEDSWILKVGLDYKVNDKLSLRGGYCFLDTPVPERTLSPASPDSEQHTITAGFGYKTGKITIDAFYSATFYEDIEVENDILSGEYENFVHYVGFSVGQRF